MYGFTKLCKKNNIYHNFKRTRQSQCWSQKLTKIPQKVLKLWKMPSKTQDFAWLGKLEKDKTVWSWLGLENIELFDFSSSSSSAWKSGLKLDLNEEEFSSRITQKRNVLSSPMGVEILKNKLYVCSSMYLLDTGTKPLWETETRSYHCRLNVSEIVSLSSYNLTICNWSWGSQLGYFLYKPCLLYLYISVE